MSRSFHGACSAFVAFAALAFSGCGKEAGPPPPTGTNTPSPAANGGHNYAGRDWCGEHGVPESECARCNDSLVAAFKDKNDWCKEHERPESQCFICHPEHKEKFAAVYKAKFGEDPPPVTDE